MQLLWSDQTKQHKSLSKHCCWSTRVVYRGCGNVDINGFLRLYHTWDIDVMDRWPHALSHRRIYLCTTGNDHNFPSMSSGIMAFCHAMNRVIGLVDVCPYYANELLEMCNSFCAYGLIFHFSRWRLKAKLHVVTSSCQIWTNSLVITYFTIVNTASISVQPIWLY